MSVRFRVSYHVRPCVSYPGAIQITNWYDTDDMLKIVE